MAAVPTSVTEYQTGFAPEIAPYAQGLLGQSYGTLFDYQKDPSGNIMYNTITDDKGKDVQGLPKIAGFKPFQEYATEDRFAQFNPLQQQSFSGAQNMLPSQATAGASQLAGLAGLGALGTSYSPNTFSSQSIATKPEDAPGYDTKGNFQMGTSALGQYMNPYMQNVVQRQQADAQRQSDIAMQAQNAQAARSGAFGGSGNYLMRGQMAGNLARQKGDIQAQGLNNAYQQAMGQFNTEQQARQQAAQLNAQQQQYGAGLGLQGLQTALSGAGTMGQLGQQQFQQGMDINKLQAQYGGEQQKQMQQMLDADYQNFINKQNYPYKQLGFMSDMIRGLPLSQTGSSVYQQPPSTLGQIGGLALGAASLFKKEGGSVHSYDNGGLTITNPDDSKLESMMDGMSNEQLQQIMEGSANPDARRVAQEELMSRASISGGMARGGMIAFKNGGDEGERTSMAGDLLRSIADPITSGLRATAEYAKLKEERDKARPGFFEQLTKAEREARIAQSKELSNRMKQVGGSSESKPADKAADPYDPATATLRRDFESKAKEKDTGSVTSAASQKIVQGATRVAEQQGVPKETFEAMMDRMMDKFKGANDKDLAGLAKMVAEEKENAKSIMGDATRQALAKFGFQMAANASQPGAGRGIAGAIRSAASAGPALSESMAESRKAAQAAQENARRMQIEFTKYKVALNKGDQQLAISTASNLRMMQQQQAQLEETIRSNRAKEGLMAQRTAASAAGRGQEKTFAPILRGIGQANQMASKNALELIKARPDLIQRGEKPEDALERVRSALAVKYRKEAVPIFKPTGNIYDSGNDDMEE
jgi:hypothetical protein